MCIRDRNHDDYLFEVAMSIVQHAAASHQCYAASLPVFWPPAIQTHNSCKPTVLRLILPESVQPAHSLLHASMVTHDRPAGVAKPIIDYYKTNIDYEKNRV